MECNVFRFVTKKPLRSIVIRFNKLKISFYFPLDQFALGNARAAQSHLELNSQRRINISAIMSHKTNGKKFFSFIKNGKLNKIALWQFNG